MAIHCPGQGRQGPRLEVVYPRSSRDGGHFENHPDNTSAIGINRLLGFVDEARALAFLTH